MPLMNGIDATIEIIKFIDEKISEYNKKFSLGLKNFLELKKIPSNKNYSLFKESILNLLETKNNLKENVFGDPENINGAICGVVLLILFLFFDSFTGQW